MFGVLKKLLPIAAVTLAEAAMPPSPAQAQNPLDDFINPASPNYAVTNGLMNLPGYSLYPYFPNNHQDHHLTSREQLSPSHEGQGTLRAIAEEERHSNDTTEDRDVDIAAKEKESRTTLTAALAGALLLGVVVVSSLASPISKRKPEI